MGNFLMIKTREDASADELSKKMFEHWRKPLIFEDAKAYKPRSELFEMVMNETNNMEGCHL